MAVVNQKFLLEKFSYKDGFLYRNYEYKRHKKGEAIGAKGARYCNTTICGESWPLHILIFIYHYDYRPECVDHIDRNSFNNKIENLRAATRLENCGNTSASRNSTSKYVGVSFIRKTKKWAAQIIAGKSKNKHIGYFTDEKTAALAYNRESVRLRGEFAVINIISL